MTGADDVTMTPNPKTDYRLADRRVSDCATEIVPAQGYRTPAWYAARRLAVSASEIAPILGLSPYQSRFDLWWAKRGGDGGLPENRAMSRGRRAEPLVIEDFENDHPHLTVVQVGLVRHNDRHWQVATPDGIAYEATQARFGLSGVAHPDECGEPVAVVEAKTAGGSEGWGERGTDQIPIHYRAQVIWQMDVLGVGLCYVPVWVGFDYRLYVVEYDAEDAAYMRDEARQFLDSLEADVPPDIDAHTTTTDRLKRLHPDVEDRDVEVSEAVVRQYLAAQRLRDAAVARMRLAENRLRAQVGNAKRGVLPDGRKVASRSVYDVPARTQTVSAFTVSKLTVTEPKSPTKKHRTRVRSSES